MTQRQTDFWTPEAIHAATAGRWLTAPRDPAQKLTGLSIDSRTITPGQVFLAIKGERFDGHDYLQQAIAGGARMLIVEQASAARTAEFCRTTCDVPTLAVDSATDALRRLATTYRDVLGRNAVRVIAVTGSTGKTTTRHLIHTVLSSKLVGTQSPKSFNNDIGVPLTLLAAAVADDFVVVEVGSNHPGEIAALTEIARPDIAVITNIGLAHTAQLGSAAQIAVEKRSLLACLPADGLAVLPGDCPELKSLQQAVPRGVAALRFGRAATCDLRLTGELRQQPAGLRFGVEGCDDPYHLPYYGKHNAINALPAIGIARRMGIDDAAIAQALAAAAPLPMRLAIRELGPPDQPVIILDDTYNANPQSMRAAIDALVDCPVRSPARRVAILGDMLELGADGPHQHTLIGQYLAERSDEIHMAVFIGKLSQYAAEQLSKTSPSMTIGRYAAWDDQLPDRIGGTISPGDVVLVKASRGMALERLTACLEQRWGRRPCEART